MLLLSVAMLFLAPSLPSSVDLQEGLIARFSFNQCDARDDQGSGSYGELSASTRCWCGVDDDGLLLDGESAFVTFYGPVNDYFNSADFTLSYYFKPEGRSAFPLSLVSKRAQCDEYVMLDMYIDFTRPELGVQFQEFPGKNFRDLAPAIEVAGWQHITLVREGLRAFTYINGQLQRESFRCSGVDIANEGLLSIANSPCVQAGRARRFKGIIDELRVYERALTPEEVKALYELFPIENAMMDCVI